MFDCHNLLHPFQNDPGTSQRQRIIDHLLSENVKIDNRSLVDLLDYFNKLSGSILYYDKTLAVSDWRPFFRDSIPIVLSSIARFDYQALEEKYAGYKYSFDKQPTVSGLRLIIYFIYYNGINTIYKWHEALRKDDLPASNELESLIRNKLSGYLADFIQVVGKVVKKYNIRPIDFSKFKDTPDNDVWNLQRTNIYLGDTEYEAPGECASLKKLYKEVTSFWQLFLDGIRSLATTAEQSIGQSLLPLEQELREQHAPHLALIFAFIRLFGKMQNELNRKTKEHLKFFYMDVLRIKAKNADPDKANIIFEVQKILREQYQKHLVSEGTSLNAGRDANNFDMLFDTDDDIVVNETQVAELRTLFLKNEEVANATYLEGAYIAPAADKADGVEKDFTDDSPKNWYTLGNKFSKHTAPGKKDPKAHPAARLGFVLASPVLFLGGGTRKVEITIDCELAPSVCDDIAGSCGNTPDCPDYPDNLYSAISLYNRVRQFLTDYTLAIPGPMSYYLISKDLLAEAVQQGMSVAAATMIRDHFLDALSLHPCSKEPRYVDFDLIDYKDWDSFMNATINASVKSEVDKLPHLFTKKWPFKITFSGQDEWIEASEITRIEMGTLTGNRFQLVIAATLKADKPAVTFYNKENLEEDLGTELPLVRLELEDIPGLRYEMVNPVADEDCCLKRKPGEGPHYVSLYHFFRNVTVKENTRIDVKVCGLKNFVVQNDENVMDVNSIIFPFGSRPKPGANFYISSKEVLCKNWSDFGITFEWKDKPVFEDHYHGYEEVSKPIGRADLNENNYFYTPYILENGAWIGRSGGKKKLFGSDGAVICTAPTKDQFYYHFDRADYVLQEYKRSAISSFRDEILRNDSQNHFLRLELFEEPEFAFHHSRYSFILTRQMMALGKWPKEIDINAVYDGFAVFPPPPGSVSVLDYTEIFDTIRRAYEFATNINARTSGVLQAVELANDGATFPLGINLSFADLLKILQNPLPHILNPTDYQLLNPMPAIPPDPIPAGAPMLDPYVLSDIIRKLDQNVLLPVYQKLLAMKFQFVVIPNEPYTPQIEGMFIDYKASAIISDIDLIHLYPYKGTHKREEIELEPSLFPTFCDEGTLFIGLRDLQPGINLNLLFQLAEATADSEKPKEKVHWHYLENNRWRKLRTGFEVLEDGTSSLTTSGIIKFAMPEGMTNKNSIMPAGIFWIKASIAKSSRAVSETLGIHTQAMRATFKMNEGNDKARLNNPLEAGSIGKLLVADPLIKKVIQPYDSFGGSLPELEGGYYLRVSEHLRHKGRSIQKWDYERMVLQEFPQVYKAKCVNHSFHTDASLYSNDVPYAPGYVLLAVIPDLRVLKAGNSFEPKVPVSLMETIENFIRKTTSPFVRLKVANPRYEKVNFCISVTLVRGKDKNFFKEKLKSDLREFLAPWAVGKYDKLTFGQCIYRSDVLRFLEFTSYVDFISELRMAHENEAQTINDVQKVCPVSPRSILVAGDIEVKLINETCDSWCNQTPTLNTCSGPVLVQEDYCRDKN